MYSHNSDNVKAIYDASPYPSSLGGQLKQSSYLLTNWVNAISKGKKALFNKSRILVAGCGSGEEALMLAKLFPEAEVLGIDFSEKSIERAVLLGKKSGYVNLNFELSDLMDESFYKKYEAFDFILCHGVADYVTNPEMLMNNFSKVLSSNGVLCMTVNSPSHPAGKIRKAFEALGLQYNNIEYRPEFRKLLALTEKMMGQNSAILGIANAPKAYLDIDIFAPIAHHDSLICWKSRAEKHGLFFCGSMDALYGLLDTEDDELKCLLKLGKSDLSFWMADLRQRPGYQMLFTKSILQEPNFENFKKLLEWKPILDSCVGIIPEMHINLEPKKLTIRFDGFPDMIINTTVFDLQVLRNCSGEKTLKSILEEVGTEFNERNLQNTLYRCYHYGLLS